MQIACHVCRFLPFNVPRLGNGWFGRPILIRACRRCTLLPCSASGIVPAMQCGEAAA
jgi:hypothetical protein